MSIGAILSLEEPTHSNYPSMRTIAPAWFGIVCVLLLVVGLGIGVSSSLAMTPSDADTSSFDERSLGQQEDNRTDFDIEIDWRNDPIRPGETFKVDVVVTYTGSGSTTRTVSLEDSAGDPLDYADSVQFGEDPENFRFTWSPDKDDTGTVPLVLRVGQTKKSLDVNVDPNPPPTTEGHFEVEMHDVWDASNAPIRAGESLNATVTVSNIGDKRAEKRINFSIDGVGEQSKRVELDPHNQTEVQFSLDIEPDVYGIVTAEAASVDDSHAIDLLVKAPLTHEDQPYFEIDIASTTQAGAGDTLVVEAVVSNTGDEAASQEIQLDIEDVGTSATVVSLEPGERRTVRLPVETKATDEGSITAELHSDDDSDTQSLILSRRGFDVEVEDFTTPVTAGEPIEVDLLVTNPYNDEFKDTIELSHTALGTDETLLGLAGGESTQVTLALPTEPGEEGRYILHASGRIASVPVGTVTIEEPESNFSVDIDKTNSPAIPGTHLRVTATVTNEGNVSDTQNITMSVPKLGRAGKEKDITPSLEPGESTEVVLFVGPINHDDIGEYTAAVRSETDTARTDVAVTELPVEVDISTNDPVPAGEDLAIDVTVRNTGSTSTGVQSLSLDIESLTERGSRVIDDEESWSRTMQFELAPGEETTEQFTAETDDDDIGEHTLAVTHSFAAVEQEHGFEVKEPEPAAFEAEIVDTNAPIAVPSDDDLQEDGPLRVTVEVTNTGDEWARKQIYLHGSEFTHDWSLTGFPAEPVEVGLDPGETQRVVLEVPLYDGDSGTHSIGVSTHDVGVVLDADYGEYDLDDTREVEVVEPVQPPQFEVEIDELNPAELHWDGPIRVVANVTNTGEATAVDRVKFDTGDDSETMPVLVQAGETKQVQLEASLNHGGSESAFPVTVTSGFDSDTESVSNAPSRDEWGPIEVTIVEINKEALARPASGLYDSATHETDVTVTVEFTNTGLGTPNPDYNPDIENLTPTWVFRLDGEPVSRYALDEPAVPFESPHLGGIAPGGSDRAEYTIRIPRSHAGEYTLEVASRYGPEGNAHFDSDTATISGEQPDDHFAIRIEGTNAPVQAGETLNVNYTAINKHPFWDEQNITLSVDGLTGRNSDPTTCEEECDAKQISLSGEHSTEHMGGIEGVLSIPTEPGDEGTYTAVVESYSGEDSIEVTILEPGPHYTVDIIDTNAPIEEGEDLLVNATVENIGNQAGRQAVQLTVPDVGTVTGTLALEPDEQDTLQFSVPTDAGDADWYDAEVASANESEEVDVTIEEPPFEVEILETNTPVTAGKDITVAVAITNKGQVFAKRRVGVAIPGLPENATAVGVPAETTVTREFTVSTTRRDDAEYVAEAWSRDDTDTTPVVVEEAVPAQFVVAVESSPDAVATGDFIMLNATITNVGSYRAIKVVELTVDPFGSHTVPIGLDPGESKTVTVFASTTADDVGEYTAEIATSSDSASVDISVEEPEPSFDISIDETNAPVQEGETIEVLATIANGGTDAGREEVQLDIADINVSFGGQLRPLFGGDHVTAWLQPQEETQLRIPLATKLNDRGEYEVTLETDDAEASTSVRVLEPARFEVTIEDTNGPVLAGDQLTVDVAIENIGEIEGTSRVEVGDAPVPGRLPTRDPLMTLTPGQERTETFTFDTEVDWTVDIPLEAEASRGTRDTDEVRILRNTPPDDDPPTEEPWFNVTIENVTEAPAGEPIVANVTIRNTGQRPGEQPITANVSDIDSASIMVSLENGKTVNETIHIPTDPDDAGEYTLTVASEDSEDTAEVTVLPADDADDPAPTDHDTPTPSGDSIPGFGLIGVFSCFLAIAYLFSRRYSR